jgi:hypothetical protein
MRNTSFARKPIVPGLRWRAGPLVGVLVGVIFPGLAVADDTQARPEHVSLWGGGGIGAVLSGDGAPFVNGHKMGMLSVSLPGDRFRIRLLKGSMERTQGIEEGTGDNDIDYQGVDFVVTQSATDLPFAFAVGAARFEEAYHKGYPDEDLGGSEFIHKWGPHVSALRSYRWSRYLEGWVELDLHYAPYDSPQTIVMLNIGVGFRF